MPEKNSYKEFDNEKKFLRLENSPPHPPHKFSNGPSLRRPDTQAKVYVAWKRKMFHDVIGGEKYLFIAPRI